MNTFDPKRQARMVVSDRLRAFFNHLKQQFSPDTEELLNRVESKQDDDKKKT